MENDKVEISQRLVACKHFRWMPGMRTLGDWRVINVDSDGVEVVTDLSEVVLFHSGDLPSIPSSLPDLTDPATLGCLLALVREAWDDNTASTAATRELDKTTGWIMDCWNPQSPLNKIGPFKTEAEALVAALEASP
jgi:hypothetical protein